MLDQFALEQIRTEIGDTIGMTVDLALTHAQTRTWVAVPSPRLKTKM